MYNAWDAHYRQVSVLRFTQDSAALLSGSEDSAVNVWSVARLLDDSTQNELPAPYATLSDHTLPVTDLVVGAGAFPRCRVLTASVDHSVKVWDLESKSLLTTFHFPRPISTLAWDFTERLFFAASPDGFIHQVNLFRQRDDKTSRIMEAVGGAGSTDIIRITDEDQQAARKRLITVDQPVTSMMLSLTSTLLLVGTASGLIHLYDVASHQLLRSIATHKGLSITHLQTLLKPPDLVGHVALSLAAGGSADSLPVRTVAPFQRMRDPKTREAHEVAVMLTPSRSKPPPAFCTYPSDELLRDHASFVQLGGAPGATSGVSLQTRVAELEAEAARLREQLSRAKGINDSMWEAVVARVVADGREKAQGEAEDAAMEVDDGERGKGRRKRARV
ncbi:WD40 repeat-like protein [Phanerochaete sordida]|uniref:Pre-rRNA-processing protein IPI3 n=1 Tax=Phanerochaete sordida TaxID=48140 RepID=A0A9P3GAI1_9APHY|nr:WD40 repeat-like protein [Phanerochaete sordida]